MPSCTRPGCPSLRPWLPGKTSATGAQLAEPHFSQSSTSGTKNVLAFVESEMPDLKKKLETLLKLAKDARTAFCPCRHEDCSTCLLITKIEEMIAETEN